MLSKNRKWCHYQKIAMELRVNMSFLLKKKKIIENKNPQF